MDRPVVGCVGTPPGDRSTLARGIRGQSMLMLSHLVDPIPPSGHSGALARERHIERRGLRLAYWIAQVCNADARDHHRVAKDGWHAGEVIKESNAGAKKDCRQVDVEFVEEAGIE